jgi:hypothetical protein
VENGLEFKIIRNEGHLQALSSIKVKSDLHNMEHTMERG